MRLDLLCRASYEIARYSCGAHGGEIYVVRPATRSASSFKQGAVKFNRKTLMWLQNVVFSVDRCLRNGSLLLAPLVTAIVLNAAFAFVLRVR